MDLKTLFSVLTISGFAAFAAQAETVDFTITGTYADNLSNAQPGVVTGQIFGLTPGGTGETPTGVTVTGAPSVFGISTPLAFTVSGAFNVNNSGQVTSGSEDGFSPDFNHFLQFDGTSNSLDFISDPDAYEASGAISYSIEAAPEPSTWILSLIGFGALFSLRRRVLRA